MATDSDLSHLTALLTPAETILPNSPAYSAESKAWGVWPQTVALGYFKPSI